MQELSKDPAFVEALLAKLDRDPRAGGMLGPENLARLRELIFGEQWERLDRFPGITVAGMGRAVSSRSATGSIPSAAPTTQTASA